MTVENRKMAEILKANLAKLRNAERMLAGFLVLLFSRMVTLESRETVESEWSEMVEIAKAKFAVSSLSEIAVLRSAKTLMSQYRKVAEVDGHAKVRELENNSSLQSRYREILKQQKEEAAKEESHEISKLESAINRIHAVCEGLILGNHTSEEFVLSKLAEFADSIVANTAIAEVIEMRNSNAALQEEISKIAEDEMREVLKENNA